MKRTIIIGSLIICIFSFVSSVCVQREETFIQSDEFKNGIVPNEETAIKIAEAIWLPIYGKEIYREKPFKANLMNDSIWVIQGTLHDSKGGTVYAEIQKRNCKVLKVTRYK